MKQVFTLQEQLEEVRDLIRAFNATSTRRDLRSVAVLKTLAADLQGRMAGAPGVALRELERRLASTLATRTGRPGRGRDDSALVGLAQELIGRWPTVRRALEDMDARQRPPASTAALADEAERA